MSGTARINKHGFKAFLVTQFLGAFNDNAFKFVIGMLAVDYFVQQEGGTSYLSLSGALFILPFILFSTYAGYLADRFSKRTILIGAKIAEIILMTIGLIAFKYQLFWLMYAVLFGMGTHSAFFSPSKYGILPEIVEKPQLSVSNGLLIMWTYAAIIFGQVFGGVLMKITVPNYYLMSYVFIGIAGLGLLASLRIPPVKAAGGQAPFRLNFLPEVIENVRRIRQDRAVFLSMVGLVYFSFLAGLFNLNILLYAKILLDVSPIQTGILLATLGTGIGLGSVVAGKLSDGKIELGLVPLGAIGLSLNSFLLGFVFDSYTAVLICLFFLGFSAGFYIVPLNALIQQQTVHDQRGQVLGTNNFFGFTAMLLASGVLYLLRENFHLDPAQISVLMGIVSVIGTGYVCLLLPYALIRFIVFVLTHTLYKIKIVNRDYVPSSGGALLVSNHVSFIDALLILVSIPRPIRFLMHWDIYNNKLLHPLFRLAKVIPISGTDNPKGIIRSLRTAREALQNGEIVCVFAEGQLTRTGNILKFNKGFEHIMKDINCPIIPVHLDRIWGSIFSFERKKIFFKLPKIIPYPVTVSFGTPMPANATAFEVRNQVRELGAEAFKYRLADRMTLPEAFWMEARKHPWRFCLADSSGKELNYGEALIAAVVLAGWLRKRDDGQNNIGILLPPSVGGALVNIAVSINHKVPVNLNYTVSKESLASIVKQSGLKTVITSRLFLEKTGIVPACNVLFIEEILKTVTRKDKIIAALKSFFPSAMLSYAMIFGRKSARDIEKTATIMFTSGSTGDPKGVMLSHGNITSNLEGLYQVFHVEPEDVILGILPFFHSFGFTANLWFPLLSGIGAVYHFNPLDAKTIGKLVQKHKATIMMSTPTFLNTYTSRCEPEQFKSLRVVVVGAEKLKASIAKNFEDKFGILPMEGYGCTELSPVVSINLPDFRAHGFHQRAHKPGKIGLPLPGVAVRVLDQTTLKPLGVDEDGLLFVQGPNVMKGYLNRPEETKKVIQDGWYCTGDIANIDEDGFITITDRLSRFSKIGGEMVPHIKVEEKIHGVVNASEPMAVVTSIPDEKKGEKLVVLFKGDFTGEQLAEALQESDLPKLWVPGRDAFFKVDSFPILGSGKLDLGAIKRKAMEMIKESTL